MSESVKPVPNGWKLPTWDEIHKLGRAGTEVYRPRFRKAVSKSLPSAGEWDCGLTREGPAAPGLDLGPTRPRAGRDPGARRGAHFAPAFFRAFDAFALLCPAQTLGGADFGAGRGAHFSAATAAAGRCRRCVNKNCRELLLQRLYAHAQRHRLFQFPNRYV